MRSQDAIVVRAADRFVTQGDDVRSRHCFSFGAHYDPANTHFGPLQACNEETLAPGAGFDSHAHEGVDIVTWVAEGLLEHADSAGGRALTGPGVVQVLHAGSGVSHSERNAGAGECRFIQSWIAADPPDGPPSYEQIDARPVLADGTLAPVLDLQSGTARMYAGRLPPGAGSPLPPAQRLHLYVVRGAVTLDGVGLLADGDSARLTTVGRAGAVAGENGAEILVWALA